MKAGEDLRAKKGLQVAPMPRQDICIINICIADVAQTFFYSSTLFTPKDVFKKLLDPKERKFHSCPLFGDKSWKEW